MSESIFAHPPSPHVLQWLAAGQLANRLQRSLRLWVLLHELYGQSPNWAEAFVEPFAYPQARDRLFSSAHPRSDTLTAQQLEAACRDRACICHKSMRELLAAALGDRWEPEWRQAVMQATGLNAKELDGFLQEPPFTTVHRSIRDDFKHLVAMGWLHSPAKGRYQCLTSDKWPSLPNFSHFKGEDIVSTAHLSHSQVWELLRVLESVAFVQPNIELVVQSLWEQVAPDTPNSGLLEIEPTQRIFLHLDYILSPEMQDRVDTYQEQLENLWRHPPVGVVQFDYWVREGGKVNVIVYPVCLHYCRRAKYLSAFGLDPRGEIAWHNYRLDRIASAGLKVLAWGDPLVPKALQTLARAGELPTPEEVTSELEAAWGFNFYLKRELLIMRFPADFARWYVDNTLRHQTFQRVSYEKLPRAIAEGVKNPQERQKLLQIIQQRSPDDAYYRAWIRTGDINVLMRLRDWRPNGEVIAPLSIRQQLAWEAERELKNYRERRD